DPRLDPRMVTRPVKAVRVLGQDLVLFRDAQGRWGLLDRDCPHRGADLSFGRNEGDGLRCPFHGWKFDTAGVCLETPAEPAGKQFRSAAAGDIAGERWPMTRIMREFHRPEISFENTPWGMQLTALRPMTQQLTHVRVTQAIFPHTFVIPLSETLTITQMHLPVDDTHTYWYSIFTSFAQPVDKDAMRSQRLQFISLPDYIPKSGRHTDWGFNPEEQLTRTS